MLVKVVLGIFASLLLINLIFAMPVADWTDYDEMDKLQKMFEDFQQKIKEYELASDVDYMNEEDAEF
ncbi:hypothetical protein CVS40_4545 [Lucilia cuprina]|nr:hypothetical protein CVS40_4545 [Lucilia cuprina]